MAQTTLAQENCAQQQVTGKIFNIFNPDLPRLDDRPLDELLVQHQLDSDLIEPIIDNVNDQPPPAYKPPHTPATYRPILEKIWPHTNDVLWIEHQDYLKTNKRVRESAISNYLGLHIRVPSGLNITAWKRLFSDYHDRHLIDFLAFSWAADFTSDSPLIPAVANHQNDDESLAAIRAYIEKETGFGGDVRPIQGEAIPPMDANKSDHDTTETWHLRQMRNCGPKLPPGGERKCWNSPIAKPPSILYTYQHSRPG